MTSFRYTAALTTSALFALALSASGQSIAPPPAEAHATAPATSPDEQELSPKGIDKRKFDAVYRATQAVKEATGVGVNFARYSELVQGLATEVAIVKDKASSSGERALAARFNRMAAVYRDCVTLWRAQINSVEWEELGIGRGSILVAPPYHSGEPKSAPIADVARIVEEYKIPTSTFAARIDHLYTVPMPKGLSEEQMRRADEAEHYNPLANAIVIPASSAPLQLLWVEAERRFAIASKTYLAASSASTPKARRKKPPTQ